MANSNLPAKITDYTALQAQSTFTEAERKAFKDLHESVKKHTKETIWWFWELGQSVAKILQDARTNQALYGKNLLERMACALGYETPRTLYNTLQVVAAFKTKKAFNDYVKMSGEAGNALTWTHLYCLAGVGDDEVRMQLAAAALESNWSAKTLADQVKALCERKPRGKSGGRKPRAKIAGNLANYINHVRGQASKFVENYDNSWTGDAFDILATIEDLPADKLTDKVLSAVADTREQVTAMREKAAELEELLGTAEVAIAAKMEAQAAVAKEAKKGKGPSDDELAAMEDRDGAGSEERTADEDEEEETELEEVEEEDVAEESPVIVGHEDEEEESEGDAVINIGEIRNRKAREERALARAKARKQGRHPVK